MEKGTDEKHRAEWPPLSEVRKSLRVQWYRCPVDRGVFAKLVERSDKEGFFQAFGHLAIWLVTGTIVYVCWARQVFMAMCLAMFAHGTVGSAFIFGCHELGHGTVFKTRWLNRLFL